MSCHHMAFTPRIQLKSTKFQIRALGASWTVDGRFKKIFIFEENQSTGCQRCQQDSFAIFRSLLTT